jgi:hypothetical protein
MSGVDASEQFRSRRVAAASTERVGQSVWKGVGPPRVNALTGASSGWRSNLCLRVLAAALLLSAPSAFAQAQVPVPGFDLDRVFSPDPGSALLLSTGEALRAGTLRLSLVGHYQGQDEQTGETR